MPLFVQGHSAWAEGVGEQLTAAGVAGKALTPSIFPGVAVRTADVFQAPELTRNSPRTTIRGFLKAGGRNDCEPVVTGRVPEVASGTRLARPERGEARLTGTGSCVFAEFRDAMLHGRH